MGAFNVENMEMVQAVVAAAEEPEISCDYADNTIYIKICRSGYVLCKCCSGSKESKRAGSLHLDHGSALNWLCRHFVQAIHQS